MATNKDCVFSFINAGFTQKMAERLCAEAVPSPTPSDPSPPLVPVSEAGGRGWTIKTGYTGTGAVVFPDTDKEASAFLKSIGRPVTPSDRSGWETYAGRLGMPKAAQERAWAAMTRKELRPKLAEALDTLKAVFEGYKWSGYSVPMPHNMQNREKGPSSLEPQPAGQKNPFSPPPASFPFHTKVSRKVHEKALQLMRMYPLEGPASILKRATIAVGVTPMVDITPEDEKLLKMAIDFAQNGPAKSDGNRIGGAPAGPFNTDNQ